MNGPQLAPKTRQSQATRSMIWTWRNGLFLLMVLLRALGLQQTAAESSHQMSTSSGAYFATRLGSEVCKKAQGKEKAAGTRGLSKPK